MLSTYERAETQSECSANVASFAGSVNAGESSFTSRSCPALSGSTSSPCTSLSSLFASKTTTAPESSPAARHIVPSGSVQLSRQSGMSTSPILPCRFQRCEPARSFSS